MLPAADDAVRGRRLTLTGALWTVCFFLAPLDAALLFQGGPLPVSLSAFRVCLLAALAVSGLRALVVGKMVVPRNLVALLCVLWFLWTWASTIWSPSPSASLRYIFLVTTTCVLILVPTVASPDQYRRLVGAALASTLLAVLCGAVEVVFHWRVPASRIMLFQNEVTSYFANPIQFGLTLALYTPLLVGRILQGRAAWRTVAGTVILVATLLLVMRSASRSALVAYVTALAVLGCGLYRLQFAPGSSLALRARRVLLALLVTIVVLLPQLVAAVPEVVVAKLATIPDLMTQTGAYSTGQRRSLLEEGVKLWSVSPLWGRGAGSAEELLQGIPRLGGVSSLHCWWLELLVNGGIVGLGLFGLMYLELLRQLWRCYCTAGDQGARLSTLCFLAGWVALIPGSFGPGSWVTMPGCWVFMGLAAGWIVNQRRRAPFPSGQGG